MAYGNLAGLTFNRLTVLYAIHIDKKKYWRCRCECGKETAVRAGRLVTGEIKSCGCLQIEMSTRHGLRHTPEYEIWLQIRMWCKNPKNPGYANYGGRGITICKRWDDFANFIADMGKRPSAKHSIDRVNNDKGYSTFNCKWATSLEQGSNKRNNRKITLDGRTQTMAQWTREIGISAATIHARLARGDSIADALRPADQPRKITFKGKSQTVSEWSKELGIQEMTIRQRLNSHPSANGDLWLRQPKPNGTA